MITVDDLKAAIAECQGERKPNANTCMKLAAYYIILRELEPEATQIAPNLPRYSSEGYSSDTEFSAAVKGKNEASVWALIDELMATLEIVQPRLYNAVIRKLKEL